jgi:hypothetical protein
MRYKLNGKDREEALGWGSQGWTAEKAAIELSKLKQARITGEGAQSLQAKREIRRKADEALKAIEECQKKELLTFGEFFVNTYFPQAMRNKKANSYRVEKSMFQVWISPTLADIPLKQISPFHLERIKKRMADAGRKARSIQYVFSL